MKRLIASSVVASVALVFAAPAQPAAPSNAKLARQIKTLQKQVKSLQKQVKQANGLAAVSFIYSGCSVAVTADALQGTWGAIDQVNGTPIFGPQVAVDDFGICPLIDIVRMPSQAPPNVSVFNSLLAVFRP